MGASFLSEVFSVPCVFRGASFFYQRSLFGSCISLQFQSTSEGFDNAPSSVASFFLAYQRLLNTELALLAISTSQTPRFGGKEPILLLQGT
jgi:hypothetical protein